MTWTGGASAFSAGPGTVAGRLRDKGGLLRLVEVAGVAEGTLHLRQVRGRDEPVAAGALLGLGEQPPLEQPPDLPGGDAVAPGDLPDGEVRWARAASLAPAEVAYSGRATGKEGQ